MAGETAEPNPTAQDHASLVQEVARLRAALKARDVFLRVAAHELRGPLAAIQLQADTIALLAKQGASPADVDARAARVSGQVQRLARLLEEVLDLARASSGRFQIACGEVDLAALVAGEVARVGDDLRRAGCEARVRAAGELSGPWDQARLEQAVNALLTAAIKTGSGEPIEVNVSARDGFAEVEVSWSGEGIAASQRALIDGSFENAVSGAAPGTNVLALWLARQVAQAHGGALEVETSRARLALPRDGQKLAR
jgi:signal transduction histidine kinase